MAFSALRRSPNEPDGLELRPTPRPSRLNRNAVLLGGVLGLAVFAAAAATLVENRTAIAPAGEPARTSSSGSDRFWEKASDGVPGWSDLEIPADVAASLPSARPTAAPEDPPEPPPRASATPDDQRRQEQLARARTIAPLVGGFRSGGGSASGSGDPAPGASPVRPRAMHPPLLGELSEMLGGKDATLRQNNQDGKREFLDASGIAERDETNPHPVREPASRYEVTAGMVIPAVLLTQGESDLPGLMTGRVTESVYDSATGQHLLIPQGTALLGVYDSVVTFGQQRLLIAWQRLIFPDGTKLNIGGMPGTDLIGAAGLRDQVDRHTSRIFGSALLLSVLTAGVTLSQEDGNPTGLGTGSTRDQVKSTLATALGQRLGDAAHEMLQREMNVQPTLRIRPGQRFNVLVNRDLVFEGPYLNTFVGGGIVP